MSAFSSHPSSYGQLENNTVLEKTQNNHSKWEMWYKTLTDINFEDNTAKAYATIFVNNLSSFSTIDDLDNDTLKPTDIDRVDHRMQILPMKPLQTSLSILPRSAATIQHCSQHLNTAAIDKCHRCKGLVCFGCREQLTLGPSIVTYCEKCADQISCTIQ